MTHYTWLAVFAVTVFGVMLGFGMLKAACDRAADEIDRWDDPATSIWHESDDGDNGDGTRKSSQL